MPTTLTLTRFLLPIILLGAGIIPGIAQDPLATRYARILLFVPNDAPVPSGYEERLRAIALRTEAFFADGFDLWGVSVDRREIFPRTTDDKVQITLVRGALPTTATGRDGLQFIRPAALAGVAEALGEPVDDNTVWWIFYHTPQRVIQGFRGSGGRNSGWAVNTYPDDPGDIPVDVELAAPEMWQHNLKGAMHEFGHALSLLHIGPNPSLDLGNSLMGPINRSYTNNLPPDTSEPRVYLSKASATLLAKHPLFKPAGPIPAASSERVQMNNLNVTRQFDRSTVITGQVTGNPAAHAVAVLESERSFNDYWARSYANPVNEDGKFRIVLNEPFPTNDSFITLFVALEDGRNNATGSEGILRFEFNGEPGEPSLVSTGGTADHLINLSLRTPAGPEPIILGFVVPGSEARSMLIRGIGPGLARYGVTTAAQAPTAQIFEQDGTQRESLPLWHSDASVADRFSEVGAFALNPTDADRALVTSLPAGVYTLHLDNPTSEEIMLGEVFAVDGGASNLSARVQNGTGDATVIMGFAIGGDSPQTVMIRAAGPALAEFGVSDAVADPRITVFDSTGNSVATNDDWQDGVDSSALQSAVTEVGAFIFAADSADAALLLELNPGAYTVHLAAESAGSALLEVYAVTTVE